MPRIPESTVETGTEEQQALLAETQRQLGRVPNLYAVMATSPAVLRGYLAMRDALSRGALSATERELLALLVAQENSCQYCVSAHIFRGKRMRIGEEALQQARSGGSDDPHTAAVLQLARTVMDTQGRVDDTTLAQVRVVGVTDEELTEIIGHVALNTLSNYVNHVAEPELDFPRVELGQPR